MKDNLGDGIKKARNNRLETIVGIWTVVVIVLLVGSVSLALVKLNSSDEKKQSAQLASEPAIAVETASPAAVTVSEPAVSGPVNETDIYANQYAYTTDVVNVRADASTISRIVTKLQIGCQVEISKKYNEEWAEILLNGQKCYVMAKYLSPVKPENATPTQAPTATATPGRATSTPKPSVEPSAMPSPTSTATASPTPTTSATPAPSKTPAPTSTPDGAGDGENGDTGSSKENE